MTNRRFPRVGDIIGYIYLWRREAATTDEGRKVRPCMVVAANETTRRVVVVPLTTKGDSESGGLPIPDDVATKAGLRGGTTVVYSETNIFTWQGYDIRPLTHGKDVYLGRMPPGFTDKIAGLTLSAKAGSAIERD